MVGRLQRKGGLHAGIDTLIQNMLLARFISHRNHRSAGAKNNVTYELDITFEVSSLGILGHHASD
jgi:hypothetical protein